jgi:hypothetical protein
MFIRRNGSIAVLEPTCRHDCFSFILNQDAASEINQEFMDCIFRVLLEAHSLKKGPL